MNNKTKTFRRLLSASFTLIAVTGAALAQDPADKVTQPSIRVTGDSTVTVKPDQAEISIGVVTQAPAAQTAAAQNAQKQDAVIAELKKLLGAGADIKTISYSLSPNYRYPKEGGQPTINGYIATNIVQVKTSDLAQVGKVIDLATGSGANTIQSLRFILKDDAGARAQALREASIKARSKAEAIASSLGLKILRVLRVEEGGLSPRPIMEFANDSLQAVRANAATTPVESGSIDVRASVT